MYCCYNFENINFFSQMTYQFRHSIFIRVSPTGVLRSDVVAKLKIDEF